MFGLYFIRAKKKINPEKPGVHLSLCSDAGTFKAARYHGNKDVERYFAFLLGIF